MLEDWTIYSWYCPNCRNEVAGLKNSKNQIRVKCKTCGSEMVRTIVGRRHDVIDIYAPSGQEHNDLELRRRFPRRAGASDTSASPRAPFP